ncbi:MAG: type 4a pilus biogenesis protein PilO, partial [Phycisphaerae bacterium]|nr:type 4a pilus biogenesis protein PilO [Phycisphaerae bacterium]
SLRISNLQKEITGLEKALEFFEDKLPKQKEVEVILKRIWIIAQRSGLNIDTVTSLKLKGGTRYNVQPIQISFNGTF